MMQDPGQSGEGTPGPGSGADFAAPEPSIVGKAVPRPLIAPAGVLVPSRGENRLPPKTDPWEHRRGEPRVFALLWTIFLFAATGITMLAAVARGIPGTDAMRPAARALMVCIAAGIAIVWPLIRLSQKRDDQPIGGSLHDLIVILVPVQAVVWPQTMWWLARWPFEVVSALAIALTAWSLVFGGFIAVVYATEHPRPRAAPAAADLLRRSGWMAALLMLTLGPGIAAAATGDAPVRWWWMLSPLTAVLELTRDRTWSGAAAGVYAGHWQLIGLTAAAALPLWVAAAALSRGSRSAGTGGRGGSPGLD